MKRPKKDLWWRGHCRWHRIFLSACLLSLVIDPLFIFGLGIRPKVRAERKLVLEIVLTVLRLVVDLFYVANILVHFWTAYVASSSRVFGRGELVIDSRKIVVHYLNKGFWIDLLVALPVPQVVTWIILLKLGNPTGSNRNIGTRLVVILSQYIVRLIMAYSLSVKIAKATGIVTAVAWVGAAHNLMFYLLLGRKFLA